MDVTKLHQGSCEEFGRRLHAVTESHWDLPTPCDEWRVRDLVGHVVGEDLWTPPLLAGQTIAEVGDRFAGDVLGPAPTAAWDQAADAAIAAVQAEGAMQTTVHLSFGDAPGEEYAWQLFADHLVHAWDLARAIGGDEHLDPGLVTACARWFDGVEDDYRAAGLIADAVPVSADADPQAKLLAHFGRDAGVGT